MKKWCFLLLSLFTCAFVDAGGPEFVEILSSKVVLQNSDGYFALSNGTCWKVISFSPRWRSVSEWWNNVQIIPDNYKSKPIDWLDGTQIEIYPVYGNSGVDLDNASNQESLKQCTNLLLNTRTGQVLFAMPLHPAQCIIELATNVYKDGHARGLIEGRSQQFKNAEESYDRGFEEGFKKGYAEGFSNGHRN